MSFFSIFVGKKNKEELNGEKKVHRVWKRREEAVGGKDDAAMKGPSGPGALFPLRGARYWCKMALCLSETPAS